MRSARHRRSVAAHLVLADGPPPADQDGFDTILLDREGFLHDQYGVRASCLYLIRPDWYIGFPGPRGDSSALDRYLDRLLIPTADAPPESST